MNLIQIIYFILGSFLSWVVSYWFFSRKIRQQTKKMVKLMRADELHLDQPEDVFENDDGQFFADLERASFNLRKKYLRLKKNTQDERAVHETIFSGLKEAVVTVDSDLHIISFNSSFMQMFKWAPISNNKNSILQDVVRDPEVLKIFKDVFQQKKTINFEFNNYQLFATALPEVEDYKDWVLGVFYDMSEIQKTEKIRVDFVANASHELRTPLTVIRGFSDLLHSRLSKEQSSLIEFTKPIVESAHHMTVLLDDLLNLSKLDHLDHIEKSILNTREITAEVLSDLDPIIVMKHKKVVCYFNVDTVLADHSSMTQILRNLIINAIRYSGDDHRESQTIVVSWNNCDHNKEKKWVELSVKDFGPGIPKEHQSRIFERFYRVDKGRNRQQGGSGLGLALVKHHTLIHGGTIELESDINQGCKFVCKFPK